MVHSIQGLSLTTKEIQKLVSNFKSSVPGYIPFSEFRKKFWTAFAAYVIFLTFHPFVGPSPVPKR